MSAPIPPRPDLGLTLEPSPSPSGRPRSTWGWWEGLGIYILATIAASFLEVPIIYLLGNTSVHGAIGTTEIVATIVADVAIAGLLVWWLSRRHREWRSAMGLAARNGVTRDLFFGLVAGAILVPALGLVTGVLEALFRSAVGHQVSPPQQVAPGLSISGRALLVLLACLVAPISEELFFRGVLFRTVRDRHGFWAAALCSAVPFGLAHWIFGSPTGDALVLVAAMVFTGVGLAWVYDRRGTLVASVAAHVVFNVIGVVTILGLIR